MPTKIIITFIKPIQGIRLAVEIVKRNLRRTVDITVAIRETPTAVTIPIPTEEVTAPEVSAVVDVEITGAEVAASIIAPAPVEVAPATVEAAPAVVTVAAAVVQVATREEVAPAEVVARVVGALPLVERGGGSPPRRGRRGPLRCRGSPPRRHETRRRHH